MGTGKTAVALVAGIHAILEGGGFQDKPLPNPDEGQPPIPNPFPPGEKGDMSVSSFVEKKLNYIVDLARDLRKNLTSAEVLMWSLLRREQF